MHVHVTKITKSLMKLGTEMSVSDAGHGRTGQGELRRVLRVQGGRGGLGRGEERGHGHQIEAQGENIPLNKFAYCYQFSGEMSQNFIVWFQLGQNMNSGSAMQTLL